MIKETDMSSEVTWYQEKMAQRAVLALKKNHLDACYVPDHEKALARIIEMIPEGSSIGMGDSVTLHQIGFISWLKSATGHRIFNPFGSNRADYPESEWDKFRAERSRLERLALTADVFVTGTNAITLDGKIVNIDGHGNRVAAMAFGPGKVIFVAGVNKIVNDQEEAIKKIHEYTSPVNVKRHTGKHNYSPLDNLPCAVTGTCSYCHSENKGCRITVVIDGWSQCFHGVGELQPTVIIVGETLGI